MIKYGFLIISVVRDGILIGPKPPISMPAKWATAEDARQAAVETGIVGKIIIVEDRSDEVRHLLKKGYSICTDAKSAINSQNQEKLSRE